MTDLKKRFQQYVGIFRGVRIPWIMLLLVLLTIGLCLALFGGIGR